MAQNRQPCVDFTHRLDESVDTHLTIQVDL